MHGYEVALAAKEFTLAALIAHAPRTPTVPTLGRPLVALSDKLELAHVAAAADVRYPATGVAGSDVASSYPLMVKSSRSAIVGDDGRVVDWSGAKVARDARELEDVATRIRAKGLTPIFQPRVERVDKVNVTVVRRDGECEVRFPYRVLRDVPLTGGIAVSLETLPSTTGIGRDAVDALDRVCAAAGYDGVANGEFCVTADGSPILIEVNTRLWGSLWFAERLGQRVTERCVRLALGLPRLPAAPAARRSRYHNVAGELRWSRLHPDAARRTAEVIADLRPWHVFEYVDVRDLGALAWVCRSGRPACSAGVADERPEWPSALVLDASARQALATVRALGRAGLEVGAAGYERSDLARDSRRAARSHRLPDPAPSGEAFHEALDALLAEHDYDVVVATDDGTIARLGERPPRVPCVPDVKANLDALGDKVALAGVARDAGVAYPETLAIDGSTTAGDVVRALGLPVVVKASTSAMILEGSVRAHAGGSPCHHGGERERHPPAPSAGRD